MGRESRPSVCYVVAGHNLLSSAGPTRNVLSLARALSEFTDVTVAFRRVLEPVTDEPFAVLEIDPGGSTPGSSVDDAAVRGIGYLEFVSYLRAIERFADRHLHRFDVVLEKSWLLSGYVSAWCAQREIAAVPVLNLVPLVRNHWRRPAKAGKNWVARSLSGRYLRHSSCCIAETDDLKASIAHRWRVPPERIEVIGLGVDRGQFRPMDQGAARQRAGIPPDRTVLVYVGALDHTHDLAPVIAGFAAAGDPALELHLVGDGERRGELQRLAAGSPRVVFHGRVPHRAVPGLIACADLCLAPYDPGVFPRGRVGYATLKVREYLASGRPVATSTSGVLPGLIRPGITGYLLENDAGSWARFLRDELPSRAELARMGAAAAETLLESWEDTARAYWGVCERVLARTAEPAGVR